MNLIPAALALIDLTARAVRMLEASSWKQDGFREAVALELLARSRAFARGSKIDTKIEGMSDEELNALRATYNRPKR